MRYRAGIQRGVIALAVAVCASPALADPVPAKQSDAFVDSIGVNIHTWTTWSPFYQRWPEVIQLIKDMGIRQVRDHAYQPQLMNQLTSGNNIKVMAIIQTPWHFVNDLSELDDRLADAKAMNNVAWLEGPNEYDGSGDPDWQSNLATWMQQLKTKKLNDPALANIPIVAPSLYQSDNGLMAPSLSSLIDAGNSHWYSRGFGPTWHLQESMDYARQLAQNKPVYATEFGYHNAINRPMGGGFTDAMPESVAAKYVPRDFLEHYNVGFAKTFEYEFVDEGDDPGLTEGEAHYGLYRYDLTPKPAAIALKNLIGALSDPGASFNAAPLDYTITGGDSTLHTTLLQKRNGHYFLAIWQDAISFDNVNVQPINVPPMPVTLSLGSGMAMSAYLLADTSTPVQTSAAATSFSLNVPDEVMLVELSAPTWKLSGSGTWNDTSHWTGGTPNVAGAAAMFTSATGSALTITADVDLHLGSLTFLGSDPHTIGGNHTLTMQSSNGGKASITAANGNQTILVPVSLASDTTVTINGGASLTISSLAPSAVALTKAGDGELDVNNVRANGLAINGGKIKVIANGTTSGVNKVSSLAVSTGATFDLTNNRLIVSNAASGSSFSGSSYGGVAGLVASGGIVSSSADGLVTRLGVASADELGKVGQTWAGQILAAGDEIVAFTYAGDANLDGMLNGDDYFYLDRGFNQHRTGWANGDFNFDGRVNGDDYFILDGNLGRQTLGVISSGAGSGGGIAPVPEPASLALFTSALLLLARRRR